MHTLRPAPTPADPLFAEQLASDVERLESYSRQLIMLWPESYPIAPTRTAAPFDRVTGAVHELVSSTVEASSERPDGPPSALWRADIQTLLAAAQEFRNLARRDLGLDDVDERGVGHPTAIWGQPSDLVGNELTSARRLRMGAALGTQPARPRPRRHRDITSRIIRLPRIPDGYSVDAELRALGHGLDSGH